MYAHIYVTVIQPKAFGVQPLTHTNTRLESIQEARLYEVWMEKILVICRHNNYWIKLCVCFNRDSKGKEYWL